MEYLKPTHWETRNLGVESFEVNDTFYESPDEQRFLFEISRKLQDHGEIFISARVKKRNYFVNPILGKAGFSFIEQTLEPHIIFTKAEALSRFINDPIKFIPKKFFPTGLKITLLNKTIRNECDEVLRVANESFSDDRFHLDTKCEKKIADFRFVYWVQDLLSDQESVFYLLWYKDELAGFMARKFEHLILAGFSRRHVGSGLGEYLWLSVLSDMQNQGMNHSHTLISANNVSVLNLYVRLGFKFKNPAVTFHFWG